MKEDQNQSVLLSFIIGAAAGVAAGMLLAPYAGKESRQKLADTASSLGNDLGGQWGTSLDKLNDLKKSVVSGINDLTGKASDKANNMADKAKDAIDYGAGKAKDAADKAADKMNKY